MINLSSLLRTGAPAKEVGSRMIGVPEFPEKGKKPWIDMSQGWFGGPRSTAQAPAPIQDDAPLPVIQNNGIIPRQTPVMMPPMAAPQQQQPYGGQNDLLRVVQGDQFGGYRALGGPVGSNQSYIVGENGPEIFRPSPTVIGGGRLQTPPELPPNPYYDITIPASIGQGTGASTGTGPVPVLPPTGNQNFFDLPVTPPQQAVNRPRDPQIDDSFLLKTPPKTTPSSELERQRQERAAYLQMAADEQKRGTPGVVTRGAIQPRAQGGPVYRKKPYIVGENGPELFVPQQPGEIIPNPDTPPAAQPQPAPEGDLNELLRISEAAKQGNQYISPLAQANAGAALPPPPAQPASAYQPAEPMTDPRDPRMQQGLDQLTAIGQNAAAQGRMPNALLRANNNGANDGLETQQTPVGNITNRPMPEAPPEPPPPGLVAKPAEKDAGPRSTADIEDAIAKTYQDSGKREKSFLKRFESGFGSAYHNWQPGEGSGGLLGLLLGSTIGGAHAAASPKEAESQQRQNTRTDLLRRLPIAQNEEKFNLNQENTGSEIQKRQQDATMATNKFIQDTYDKAQQFALKKYGEMPSYKKGQDPEIDRLGLPDKTEKDAWQLHVIDDGGSKRAIAFNPRTLESKEIGNYAKTSSGNPEKDYPDELFGLENDKSLEERAKGTVDPGTKTYKVKQNANIPNAFVDENGNFDQAKYWDAWRKGKTTAKPTEIFDESNDYSQRLSAETSRLRDEQKGTRQEVAKFRTAISSANGNVPASKTDVVDLFQKIMGEKDQAKRSAMLAKFYARIPSLRIQ